MHKNAITAWIDGILIQPQHLEQQERAMKDHIFRSIGFLAGNAWGVDTCLVDEDSLELNKISFKALSGRFQDGTVFHVSGTDLNRVVIDIQKNLVDELIYLTLAMNEEISEHPATNKRFYLADVKLQNSLTPSDPEIPVVVKKLNLCLCLADQLNSEYSAIPILKIKRADDSKGIVLEEKYIPPHFNSKNIDAVMQDLEFVLGLLERKQKQLANSIAAPLQTRTLTSQTDISLLQLLNRAVVHLQYLRSSLFLSPADLYQFYVLLLAELGTFYKEDRMAITVGAYSHKHLTIIFKQARQALVEVLKTRFEHQAVAIELIKQKEMGTYQAYIDSDTLLQNSDLILTIRGPNVVDNQTRKEYIKLADVATLRDIVYLQLAGVELERLNVVPPQIPYYEDALYFRVRPEGKLWGKILKSKELALYDELQSGDELNLWAIPKAKKDN